MVEQREECIMRQPVLPPLGKLVDTQKGLHLLRCADRYPIRLYLDEGSSSKILCGALSRAGMKEKSQKYLKLTSHISKPVIKETPIIPSEKRAHMDPVTCLRILCLPLGRHQQLQKVYYHPSTERQLSCFFLFLAFCQRI